MNIMLKIVIFWYNFNFWSICNWKFMFIPIILSLLFSQRIDYMKRIVTCISNQNNLRNIIKFINCLQTHFYSLCINIISSLGFYLTQKGKQVIFLTLKWSRFKKLRINTVVTPVGHQWNLNIDIRIFFLKDLVSSFKCFLENIDNFSENLSHGSSSINSKNSSNQWLSNNFTQIDWFDILQQLLLINSLSSINFHYFKMLFHWNIH